MTTEDDVTLGVTSVEKIWHMAPHHTFALKPAALVLPEFQMNCREPRLDVIVCPLSSVPVALDTIIRWVIGSLMVSTVPEARLNCENLMFIDPPLSDEISLM